MKGLKKVINKCLTVMLTISGILVGLSAFMATINALLRKIASFSFPWAEELCTYAVVMAAFLAIPYLEFKGRQLSVDLLANAVKNKPKAVRALRIFSSIIIMVVCCVIVWYGWISSMTAIETEITTFVLSWPRAIYFIFAVVCLALAVIASIFSIILDGPTEDEDKEDGDGGEGGQKMPAEIIEMQEGGGSV